MSVAASAVAASAPGKVVLWGEYAVLDGAPALVMAVNRYATCNLEPSTAPGWQISASGFKAAAAESTATQLLDPQANPADHPISAVLRYVLQTLPSTQTASLPDRIRAHLDTRGFHQHGAKLGLGSSAALCVAVYGAVCGLLGRPRQFEDALDAHRRLQGGSGISAGSGVDIAAAWHGGTLRCQRAGEALEARSWQLPGDLQMSFIWTGRSTSTRDHLGLLGRWLDNGGGRELDDLGGCARTLFESGPCPDSLTDYVAALAALDRAAGLGIFSAAHQDLGRLAIDAGVVYKPCGAGGGDVGAGFSQSADAIERFNHLATAAGYLPLALETASHGIQVTG